MALPVQEFLMDATQFTAILQRLDHLATPTITLSASQLTTLTQKLDNLVNAINGISVTVNNQTDPPDLAGVVQALQDLAYRNFRIDLGPVKITTDTKAMLIELA